MFYFKELNFKQDEVVFAIGNDRDTTVKTFRVTPAMLVDFVCAEFRSEHNEPVSCGCDINCDCDIYDGDECEETPCK
jgi:hypothetical protein